ncbi:MAG TPA: C40 family peptidase [Demequina sp.]|nr:C40 family peptidase [Demequina sp.]
MALRLGTVNGRTRAAVATLAAAVLLVGSATTVLADPTAPSDRDVRAAQQAVTAAQMSVAEIEVRLAQQSVERDAAVVAVQAAGEKYTQAESDRLAAADTATEAATRSAAADAQAETARRSLVAIARQTARSGGSMDTIEAVLSADGFRQVVDRSTSAAVERARQDQLDADRQARADAAAEAQRRAATPAAPAVAAPAVTTVAAPKPATTTPPTTTTTTPPAAAAPAVTPPAAPVVSDPLPPAPTPTGAYGLGTGRSRGTADQGAAAVAWASAQVGLPYVYGSAGFESFDCSGLTMRSWQAAGVNLGRTSRDQYKQVLKISYDDMRPGDLVFYSTDQNNPDAIYHVAMWIGGNQVVEAPRAGVPVRITSMRWAATMPFAGRA